MLYLKKTIQLRGTSAQNGPVLLHKHIGVRQGAQKAKAFHIPGKGVIVATLAYEFNIVMGRKTEKPGFLKNAKAFTIIDAKMINDSGKLRV
ncbi:MAG: hypothetical protein GY849_09625 [Deltaproteobacteria bacterium]|nr:hypothetical protein [Deltaproteobacteria bacterium]